MGNEFQVGVRISAKDDTQSALKSVLAGVSSFAARVALKPITLPLKVAQGSLGFLRDINLGLRPVVESMDRLIQRGSGLQVVRKSFEALTGKTGDGATRLAQEIVAAANGGIRLAEAMQIANRAGSTINLKDLKTAVEFISKKAITTGKDAGAALDTVITGLIRGSTLFLDDFGILVDGMDGVKRTFDAIKGSGAFDALGPAAQKAETIRQAIAEMQQQMGKIGVSGKETIFVYTAIKNQIGNVVDRMFATIAGSKALKDVLTGTRDVLGGITEHFEKGGSFKDLIFGKGGSNGLAGIASGLLLDIGESVGRGVGGGVLKALSAGLTIIPELISGAANVAFPLIKGMMDDVFNYAEQGVTDLWNLIKSKASEFKTYAQNLLPKSVADYFNIQQTPADQPATQPPYQRQRSWRQPGQLPRDKWNPLNPDSPISLWGAPLTDPSQFMFPPHISEAPEEFPVLHERDNRYDGLKKLINPKDFTPDPYSVAAAAADSAKAMPVLVQQSQLQTSYLDRIYDGIRSLGGKLRGAVSVASSSNKDSIFSSLSDWLESTAKSLFQGLGFYRADKATNDFTGEFKSGKTVLPKVKADAGSFPLNREGELARAKRLKDIERENRSLPYSRRIQTEANKQAHEQAQELRGFISKEQLEKEVAKRMADEHLRNTPGNRRSVRGRILREHRLNGREVTPADESRMARENRNQLIESERERLRQERERIEGELDPSRRMRFERGQSRRDKESQRYARSIGPRDPRFDLHGDDLTPHGGPSYEDLFNKFERMTKRNPGSADKSSASVDASNKAIAEHMGVIRQGIQQIVKTNDLVAEMLHGVAGALVGETRKLTGVRWA